MRVFAISDLHVDYEDNLKWIYNISSYDFTGDILVVAGDISDSLSLLERALSNFVRRFKVVLFVPGNHELWISRDKGIKTSLDKYTHIRSVVEASGAQQSAFRADGLCILPLLSWYDYSFGQPTQRLLDVWMDFRTCQWPTGFQMDDVATHFEQWNYFPELGDEEFVITFSHFLPRIDVLPKFIPDALKVLNPILGATRIERQIRKLNSKIHIYGHSHVNQHTHIEGITYVNNALGYPHETRITSKRLRCVYTVGDENC
ncbi:MAG: metallophosphoesterase [Alphaproteobacteria bacterium]